MMLKHIYGLPKHVFCAILSLTKNPSSPSCKTMFKTHLIALAAALMLVANGDSFAIDTSENLVSTQMMMQLRPGMSKSEVLRIMGNPRIPERSENNRWEYTYQKVINGEILEQRNVVLLFENDALRRVNSTVIAPDTALSKSKEHDSNATPASDSTISATNSASATDGVIRSKQTPKQALDMELQAPYQSESNKESDIAPGSIVLEGDKMDFYLDRQMRSFGNASIKKDKQSIYGDKIEYDVQNDELHVVGNTRIEADGMKVWGPELRIKLYDTVGEMQSPSFELDNELTGIPQIRTARAEDVLRQEALEQSLRSTQDGTSLITENIEDALSTDATIGRRAGKSRGDAKTVLFEGENKKLLKTARYTTCEVDNDDWYIKASELEIDNYTKTATAWNARVEFMGVPLLYTPWIDFSYLNQRKSGFLSPTVGTTSRSGFEVLVPYYWNIAPNMDATIGTRALSKRGVQLQGEFRYLGDSYSGTNNAEYLPSDSQSGDDRYYLNLQHRQSFGNGWSGGYNIERVSDDEYFSELSTAITVTSRVNLPQQGYLNYADDVWSFNGLVQKYQTLGEESAAPYDRLPQLTLNGAKDYNLFRPNLYTQWVGFDRDENKPNRLLTDSGQLFTGVTGSRFVTYPSVAAPFERPYGYITPKFGVHYTSYSLDDEFFEFRNAQGIRTNSGEYESGNRSVPIFSLDSGLFFDREVKVVDNTYTQTLEPRLFYVYIPYRDQDMFPVFDTAEADLNLGTLFLENQFTGNDRINDANQLSLAFTTRMIDAKTGIQRLAATLGQRFYFSDQQVTLPGDNPRTENSTDIVAAITARLTNDWNVDAAWQYNTDSSNTVKSNIGARYNPEPGKVLNLSYRYTADRLEQINVSGQWPLGRGWYGMGRFNYSLFENQPIEGIAGIEYDAGCWQARSVLQRVSTATADANYAIFFQLELGGLTSIGSNPMRLLQRSIPGYISTGEMSSENQIYE
jgi:LPS-assembly protein